jgi:hypothetical protein
LTRVKGKTIARTQLLAGRSAADYDAQVLEIIRAFPHPQPGGTLRSIGVADETGHIYRRIDLFCPMEVLVLQAKLNAAGFSQHPAWRGAKHRVYAGVFRKNESSNLAPDTPGSHTRRPLEVHDVE